MIVDYTTRKVYLANDTIPFDDIISLFLYLQSQQNINLQNMHGMRKSTDRIIDLAQENADFFGNPIPGSSVMRSVADTLERLVALDNAAKDGGSNE